MVAQITKIPPVDPAHDILQAQNHPLHSLFKPRSVAVVGATEREGSVGRTVFWNLISHPFGGTVYPVNPKRHNVLGIRAYPTLRDIPESIDLVVIAIPAPGVAELIQECVEIGVKGAIILSAGFKEIGSEGIEMERQILEIARGKCRIIGPNCLGVMNPLIGLNATFASQMASPGNVGFISQSGALCTSILDWSLRENVGFSSFISIGSMLDIGWGDLIDYLGDDPYTQSIVIYMESIGDARSFLSAAREVALTKPIIVIKAGRTAAAAQAAASHTGSLTGSDAVLDAAFRRCGVLRVESIEDLFDMAEVLAKQPRPRGSRLTIITNAGGPGVLATDALLSSGATLATLNLEMVEALNRILPTHWSHSNPIDLLGDAEPERYAQALDVALESGDTDGLLLILTPQAMTDPTATATQVVSRLNHTRIPIIASWMGGAEVDTGEAILNQAGIPTYRYPDQAARIFGHLWRFSDTLRGLYETPILPLDDDTGLLERHQVMTLVSEAHRQGRTLLTEAESKQILTAYGIPTVPTRIALTSEEALTYATELGYPVVLKLHSYTITHKTDVGGVKLNLSSSAEVEKAFQDIQTSVTDKVGSDHFQGVTVQPMIRLKGSYELILGSSQDPQFGPVLLFGTGGQLVEVFRDQALGLPPLNSTLARRIMERTRIYQALKGVRGQKAVDLNQLEQLLVHFSQLVVEQPYIKEIEINPLLVSGEGLIGLDARVILHDSESKSLSHPVIRPYPSQYVKSWITQKGLEVSIRPIRPEDEPLLVEFHQTLSEKTVYLRYFHLVKLSQRIAHDRLTRICFNDYDREIALVIDYKDPETQKHQVLAVGRLSKLHGIREAEFGLLVHDTYQNQGLGTELLRRLVAIGQDENLDRIRADILMDNLAMQQVCKKIGFTLAPKEGMIEASFLLS